MFTSSRRSHDRELLLFHQHDPVSWVYPLQFGRGLAAGTYRRDWTWLALVDDRPVARGVWWGPVGSVHPIELHCLIVDATLPHPEVWASALIRSAHQAFAEAGAILAPDFVIEVPESSRESADVARALAWRREAAAAAGLATVTETLVESGLELEFEPGSETTGSLHVPDASGRSTRIRHSARPLPTPRGTRVHAGV